MYLLSKNEATWTAADNIHVEPQLPAGAWTVAYRPPNDDPYLKRVDNYDPTYGPVYGNPKWIADHVANTFQKLPNQNLGVLLSGHKGLGKSLTIKLIVARLIADTPIVFIDQFTPALPDVLAKLPEAVIVADEFEKMFRDKPHGEGMTPQEALLSVMDGTKSSGHRLFLMSINNIFGIDENLICRPGRVRYHFRFGNITEQAVKDYCHDNLKESRWPEIPDVIDAVRTASVQSLDIVGAIVSEMNLYDTTPVSSISSYMNIGETRVNAEITVTVLVDGKPLVLQDEISCADNGIFVGWVHGSVFLKMRPGPLSLQGRTLPKGQYQADRFDSVYPSDEETLGDPFWNQFKDEDGDIVVRLNDPKFRADHGVVIASVFVQRRPEFGAF